jgi:KUP system potassium uptake protein
VPHHRIVLLAAGFFKVMHRNALAATEFLRIPPNRVVARGSQTEI